MIDGIECFPQVDEYRTNQPALVNVPSDCVGKAHGGPLSGMTLSEIALIGAKNFVALKISV